MTQIRKRPKARYHAILVKPEGDFEPTNWQDKPKNYRIIEYLGPKQFRGRADAWRFLHNHRAISENETELWALCLE